jgi:quercetin dioxygenase-like cupin family protein
MSGLSVVGATRYDEARQFLMVTGLVARQLATHQLAPRPKRDSQAAAFDELGGNTTLGIHLSEISAGGHKRGHRHVDEALIYIVTGRGWSELRQDDSRPMQRIDWKAGDLLSIPSNAWHQHFNSDADATSRQLAFKNTRLLRSLFGSRDFVYANDFRFTDRYADEDDYWTSRRVDETGKVQVNAIQDCAAIPIAPAPELGAGVSRDAFLLGGHRMLELDIVELGPGAHIAPQRPLAEEAVYVLKGSGTTRIWNQEGVEQVVDWSAGDLLSAPFHAWRRHEAGAGGARYLRVRNNFIELALGTAALPERFPIEPPPA